MMSTAFSNKQLSATKVTHHDEAGNDLAKPAHSSWSNSTCAATDKGVKVQLKRQGGTEHG